LIHTCAANEDGGQHPLHDFSHNALLHWLKLYLKICPHAPVEKAPFHSVLLHGILIAQFVQVLIL
jgi:hypothetical protein